MSKLIKNSYGKSRVRLTRVQRTGSEHTLKELTVAISLEGDFEETYLLGDNNKVVATDTMKNTVYALARHHPVDSVESFGLHLAEHFLTSYEQVESATITIEEDAWSRIEIDGHDHPTAFVGGSREKRTARITGHREGRRVMSGLKDLLVLKTTNSGFSGFPRDQFTTLPETDDRILATSVAAEWCHAPGQHDWNPSFDRIRSAMLKVFAEHHSLSVQQTLHLMGEAALEACPHMEEISFQLPNAHRLLVNLEPMGMDNPNEIFVPTDEPYGLICGTIRRE